MTEEYLATREAYGKILAELGEENKDMVVLDADLSGSTRTCYFAKKFPDRFFNMGVSEQDMICTAAGFAAAGKIPFISTFAIFASGRGWEQIRQSIAMPNANVKIVPTHGGITVGPDGPTHQSLEDITLMRVIPNMTVIVPADAYETEQAIKNTLTIDGPCYIRLMRGTAPVIYDTSYSFKQGRAKIHQIGEEVTIIACGLMVSVALKAAASLEKEGISTGVINMATIKPIDEDAIIEASKGSKMIVTIEEHSIIGGLGSAVAEVVSENNPMPVKRIGINDLFGQSGKPEELLEYYNLTENNIITTIHKHLSSFKNNLVREKAAY